MKQLNKLTGIKIFNARYPPGILTNPQLETFIEPKIMMVCDPWADLNAVKDAVLVGIPVIGLCDTNNQANNVDLVVPANNKGKKSVGLVFYLLAREWLLKKGLATEENMPAKMEDFVEE